MTVMRGLAVAALAAVCLAAPAGAQSRTSLELIPFIGRTLYLSDLPSRFALERESGGALIVEEGELEDPGHLGLGAGLRFGENWCLEGMFAWFPTAISGTDLDEADVTALVYGVSGVFHVPVWGRVGPFLGLGIGGKRFDYDLEGVRSDHKLMGHVVGGVAVELADRFELRFEGRHWVGALESGVEGVDDTIDNDLMLSTALAWTVPLGR